MRFSWWVAVRHYLGVAALLWSCIGATWTTESDVKLSVKPAKCISLRKGQECFQTLLFRWSTSAPGNYCLYMQEQVEPLQCWDATGTPPFDYTFEYELVARETREFYLRSATGETLQQVRVVVASVYKSGNRAPTSWRVF
jgi:hypothetical protein